MARKRSSRQQQQRYWFRMKRYGWGWTPATWEGWAVLVVYIVLLTLNFYRIDTRSNSVGETLLSYIPETIVLTILLMYVCVKTGEWPRWRWGK